MKGVFAVDAGFHPDLGQVVGNSRWRTRSRTAGFDLTPPTLCNSQGGNLDFTIDQDPYMQGFLPVLGLYLSSCPAAWSPRPTRHRPDLRHKSNVQPYMATAAGSRARPGAEAVSRGLGAIGGT